MANPLLGVFFHATGGFAAGSFYLPIKKVKKWAWESAWIMNGLFAWLLVPLLLSLITVPETFAIISYTPRVVLLWTYFFGVLLGIGGLSFGMALRYLGISLSIALALGITAAFDTLIPPLYNGEFNELIVSPSNWTLHMVFIIIFGSLWGLVTKEWHGTATITKLNLGLGLAILIISTMVIGLSDQIASI